MNKIKEQKEQYLTLKICYPDHNLIVSSLQYRVLTYLFGYITTIISIKTNAGYYIRADSEDLKSRFKLNLVDKDETFDGLIQKRVECIKETLENFDFEIAPNNIKWCLRSIKTFGINTDKFLYIKSYSSKSSKKHYIKLKIFEKNDWKIKVHEYFDKKANLKIRQIVDPLLTDYGLYVNHSKKFDDFCICWNALHLYEHLMVPWDILDNKQTLMTNGFTTPTGLCYCFTICSKKKMLIDCYNTFISFFNKVRKNPSFLKDRMKLEVMRTYSESIDDKDFSSFGKYDPILNDNTEILRYYANQPLEILVITKKKIDISKFKSLDKPYDVPQPKKRTFDEPTISMFRNRMIRTVIIENMKHKTNKSICGVDCVMNSTIGEDLSEYNTLLSNTFRTLTEKDLEKYLNNSVIPNSNFGISKIDDSLFKTAFYTFDSSK